MRAELMQILNDFVSSIGTDTVASWQLEQSGETLVKRFKISRYQGLD